MQAITILALALCLAVIYNRARKSRTQSGSSIGKRFKTGRLLIGAIVVWLVINMQLQRLNRAIGGEPLEPSSTWEKIVQTLSDWGI